jgi:hypothetical protein
MFFPYLLFKNKRHFNAKVQRSDNKDAMGKPLKKSGYLLRSTINHR